VKYVIRPTAIVAISGFGTSRRGDIEIRNIAGNLEIQPRRVFNLVHGMQCVVFEVALSGDRSASIQISST
jgi:hypothetical protein